MTDTQVPFSLHCGDSLAAYPQWPQPDCIISDGPYGIGQFAGDPATPDGLDAWYAPHLEAWAAAAKPSTTLWLWGTEIGWATVHPAIDAAGWDYVQAIHWDKGIGHIAGNVNSKTIRRFPVVNELVAFYSRRLEIRSHDGPVAARKWLLDEWIRAGLPRRRANDACGVRDAATRKYFDQGWRWYPPAAEQMQRLVDYANEHGCPNGRPYYSLDGQTPMTGDEWASMRYRWHHEHGITNVWSHPPLRDNERLRGRREAAPRAGASASAAAHLNQKPLTLMRRIIGACTEAGDIVWEPFGGLCSASVAAVEMGRSACAAEIDGRIADIARTRLEDAAPRNPAGSTAAEEQRFGDKRSHEDHQQRSEAVVDAHGRDRGSPSRAVEGSGPP